MEVEGFSDYWICKLELYHYIHKLETLESLKVNANGLISSSISYCDDMYLCQIG